MWLKHNICQSLLSQAFVFTDIVSKNYQMLIES